MLLHSAVFLLPKHGLKGTPLHTAVSLGLLVGFVLWRILPLPLLFWAVVDQWGALGAMGTAKRAAVLLSFPIPPAIFVYWFFLLVRGALRASRGGGGGGGGGGRKK